MSDAQMDMKQTRYASSFGAAVGVSIGCFLGMFPLLFIEAGQLQFHASGEESTFKVCFPRVCCMRLVPCGLLFGIALPSSMIQGLGLKLRVPNPTGANDADHISYLVQEARLHGKNEMEKLGNQHDQ